nr:hypothetical protein [Tanacetum cinerariifolium]
MEPYSRRGCKDNADLFQSSDVFVGRSCGYCVVFGALCYPTNDSKDLGKLQPIADTRIFVGYAPSRKGTGPAPNFLTPGQISSGLVPNSIPATPYAPPPIKNRRFYFNQCSMNIWNLLVLKDWFLLLKQNKLQSTQP